MSERYEEIIEGETISRSVPGARHEKICNLLHTRIAAALVNNTTARLLTPRSVVQIGSGTLFRPDLALVTAATGKLWLAAEIINSGDHQPDTVLKKGFYEQFKVPRLWMVDPRYDNVEVYHATEYGLALRKILATKETLEEALLPEFQMKIADLFAV